MPTSALPREEAIYLAGIFDGEGSINISVRDKARVVPRYFLRVSVDMNHRQTVETFQRHFGGRMQKSRGGVRAKGHCWVLRCNEVRAFLLAIGPLLRIKRAQADLALEFMNAHTFESHTWNRRPVSAAVVADRLAFYERMGELNQSHWWKKRQATAA